MALRKIGEGITDANGRFVMSYTGTGAGKLQLVAKYGEVLSQTYEVIDCIYYDGMTSDTNANYYFNGNNGTTLSYATDNQALKITCGTGSGQNYVDLRTSNTALDLSVLLGQTVRVSVNLFGLNGKRVRFRGIGANSTLGTTDYLTADGIFSFDVTIPSGLSSVIFRIDPHTIDWTEGSTYFFKDFEIYPI